MFALRAGLSAIAINVDKSDKLRKELNNLEQQKEIKNNELSNSNNSKVNLQKKINLLAHSKLSFKTLNLEEGKPEKPFRACLKAFLIPFIILFLPLNSCIFFLTCASTGCFSFNSNDNMSPFNSFLDWFYYFLLCLSVSFFISLVVFIFKQIKFKKGMKRYRAIVEKKTKEYEIYKIKKIDDHKNEVEARKKELIAQIKETDLKYVNKKREFDDFLTYKEKESNQITNTISNHNLINSNIKASLIEQFSNIINISDWRNIDLILFYLQTGRADTVKEALYQLDRQRQAEMIASTIKQATEHICNTINTATANLMCEINNSFSKLCTTINMITHNVVDTIDSLASNVNETNKINAKILDNEQLSSALLEKLNVSSDELIRIVHAKTY